MTQHAGLTLERWQSFSRDQQLLMIANEMNRGCSLLRPESREQLRNTYERALALADLTIESRPAHGFRREFLRWRDLVAALYVAEGPDAAGHRLALRTLLLFSGATATQIRHLPGLRD